MAEIQLVDGRAGRKPPSEIRMEGAVAYVALTRGMIAIIDAADVPIVQGYRWTTLANNSSGHVYAARYEKGKVYLMHRLLLNAPPDRQVDHRDGDGLNNRRENLRLATPAQNMANKVVERRARLGLKGVWQRGGMFRAQIKPNGKTINLGSYRTKEEAAAAYRGAAKVLWGDFAYDPEGIEKSTDAQKE